MNDKKNANGIINCLQQFIGLNFDNNLINGVQAKINEYLYIELGEEIEYMNFKFVESNGIISLKPKNLFTALFILGHYRPYSEIKEKEIYCIEGIGTIAKDEYDDTYFIFKES